MNANKLAPHLLFDKLFTIKHLQNIFESKVKAKQSKGIDRIDPSQFSQQAKKHLKIIKYKCIEKTYKFSPYVEIIKPKGRNKVPRVISVPTVRDRVVLYALKEILDTAFNDCIRRKLANTYIHDLQKAIIDLNVEPKNIAVISTDIKKFYDSINRKKLIETISTRIKSKKILVLIERAISTPSVPKNYRKSSIDKYKTKKGIPQGLSISNILADIYVSEYIDNYIQNNYSCNYFRYVDDILIIGQKECMDGVEELIKKRLDHLNLTTHSEKSEKTFSDTGDKPFEYLGYRFELPKITVRQSTIDKFIVSIAAKFSDYIHNKQKRLDDKDYLNKDKLKEVFLIELNEKITGAISDTKRYGWIFYFHAVNDRSLLHKIDAIVSNFFKRLDDFNNTAPNNLKKISRAYYEVKDPRRINSGYIHNYNQYQDRFSQESFLIQRGHIDPNNNNYSDSYIKKIYQRVRSGYLSQLEKDDANIY